MSELSEETRPVGRPAIKRTPRPRDRKLQIVAAARQLFAEKGYDGVSADEIAGSVGITGGALYRHFGGKQDLLVHALIDALDAAAAGVENAPSDDIDGVIGALTRVSGENRELGVLWSREIRLLDGEHRAVVYQHFFAVFGAVEQRLALARADLEPIEVQLLTWSVLAVLTSVAYHDVPMTPAHVQFLDALAKAVCRAPLDGPGADADRPVRGRWPQAKRELILSTAADLFHRRGYAGTSMAEIGERVGMSGSAVYRYHPTKADLLSAVISRALNVLQLQLSEALAASEDAVDALGRLVDSYIGFAVRNPSLVGILLSEARNVADDEALAVRRTQREYLAEWEHLLQECRSDLTSAQARILVQAVLSVVNDATRTAALQRESNLAANLALISRLILGIDA